MSDSLSANLKDMEIGQLRAYAKTMRIALAKTDTKPEIIKAIENKLAGKSLVQIADGSTELRPGTARIRLLEDPKPGSSNYPAFASVNGYAVTIPRGVDVIVPLNIVEILQNAVVNQRRQTMVAGPNGREEFRETTVKVPSYPFQILDIRHGESPKSPLEKQKEKMMAPRKQFRDKFLYWPTRAELARAIEQGLITLDAEEKVVATPDIIDEQED